MDTRTRPSAAEMLDRTPSQAVPSAFRERLGPAQQAMPPFSFDQARIALAASLQRVAGEIGFLREMLERSAGATHPNIAPLREGLVTAIDQASAAYMSVGRCAGCLNPRLDPKGR